MRRPEPRNEHYIYADDNGEPTGFGELQEFVERIEQGRKVGYATTGLESFVGKRSRHKYKIDRDVFQRLKDPQNPLSIRDFTIRAGRLEDREPGRPT